MSKNSVMLPKGTSLTIEKLICGSQTLKLERLELTKEPFVPIVKKWIARDVTDVRKFLQKIPNITYKFGTKEWVDATFNTHNGV